jgi:hypothetical protein
MLVKFSHHCSNDISGNKEKNKTVEQYLGYTFNERPTDKAHIRQIVRKANKVVRCVWGIGERKWGGDFKR